MPDKVRRCIRRYRLYPMTFFIHVLAGLLAPLLHVAMAATLGFVVYQWMEDRCYCDVAAYMAGLYAGAVLRALLGG